MNPTQRKDRRSGTVAGAAFVLPIILAILLPGCPPPPPATPGFVHVPPREKRSLDVNIQAGATYPLMAGFGLHFDPYISKKTSIPVNVDVGLPGLLMRAGGRYRLAPGVCVGAGTGLGFTALSTGIPVDLETVFGWRWKWFALSAAMRPAISFGGYDEYDPTFYTVGELAFAFVPDGNYGLSVSVVGGVQLPVKRVDETMGAVGGALGLVMFR